MLFVIVHQAYELWFKQILWELDAVIAVMGQDVVAEKDLGARRRPPRARGRDPAGAAHPPRRAGDHDAAGLPGVPRPAGPGQRLPERAVPPHREPPRPAPRRAPEDQRAALHRGARRPSTSRCWRTPRPSRRCATTSSAGCERTPFLHWGSYDFWEEYRGAVERMLDAEQARLDALPETERADQQAQHDATEATFATLFDRDRYEVLRGRGPPPALARGVPRRAAHHALPRRARAPHAVPPAHRAHRHRRGLHDLAPAPRAHGPPHDRHEAGHRRHQRPPLPAGRGRAPPRLLRPLRALDVQRPALAAARRCPTRSASRCSSRSAGRRG